ncbi:MAG: lysine--tRNA ligase [Candidatus Diapherotrites archaeon]
MPSRLDELEKSKRDHLQALRSKGIDPFPYSFPVKDYARGLREKFDGMKAEERSSQRATIAGRIMSVRSFGKLSFCTLRDATGDIQVMVSEKEADKKSFELISFLDAGDFLGVEGTIIKTKKGELSILASKLSILSKSINSLPEKWHGLTDIETRYRKRYLDLVMNPEVKTVFAQRAKIIQLVRKFLGENCFLEVETPLLQPNYGGANARPFITKSHAWKSDFYLSISPELYLKRLIVGGFGRVYTICKNFRNEDVDKTHNPEFTMLECYSAYWDYEDVMKLTENLFAFVAKELNGTTKIKYQGKEIELKPPWKRLTVEQGLKQFAKLDVAKMSDAELKKELQKHELEVEPFKRGLAVAELFKICEEHLVQPIFILDHPKETTPLCKPKRGNPALIERFEPYINGWEMGNAYSELNDPDLQEKFFKEQADQGRAKGQNHPQDFEFVEALRYGMPPCGGLGVGIDRMVMLLLDQPTIKDVLFFPQLRPERKTETVVSTARVAVPEKFEFEVDPKIKSAFPALRVGVLVVEGADNSERGKAIASLQRSAEKEFRKKFEGKDPLTIPQLKAWRDAYNQFGGNPSKNKPSVDALARRVLNGNPFPSINPLVDLYNYVSLKYLLPAGGDDLDKVQGKIRLCYADGSERFVMLGTAESDSPEKGEVVYKDDVEVLCRRWNWREADKTKFTPQTKRAAIYVESLRKEDNLDGALEELASLVQKYCKAKTNWFIV